MLKRFISIMVSGVLFALPRGALVYVFFRVLGILKKLEAPLADKMGVEHLLGEFTYLRLGCCYCSVFCLVCCYSAPRWSG
ncbi:hypothetical protein HNQ50_002557 [Silvimonas terrae]|uniref:Uncharacterized protein n=1 Tax=Silvimonas terrae TaxID=300266 RepID=A0A840RFL6_9NEIS|nr:hypothetical protein [Silvimonas terrae]MBB5191827.1 hypothetical protein [Silvimonas terrae]